MEDIVERQELLEAYIVDVRKKVKEARNASDKTKKMALGKAQNSVNGLKTEIEAYERTIQRKNYKQHRGKEFQRQLQAIGKDLAELNQAVQLAAKADPSSQVEQENPQNREVVIARGRKAQGEMQDMARNMLRDMQQANEIADNVNLQLDNQIEQLDRIYNETKDTESELERAEKHLRYFARQVYTDKILMCMLVLVVLAIIAVIILTIVKGGGSLNLTDAIT